MSIYASLGAPTDEHSDDCTIWKKTDGLWEVREDGECSCGLRGTPIVYHGSHIHPASDAERGGWIDIALIPSHCGPDGYVEDEDGAPWPFLRFGVNGGTVVLEPAHVREIIQTLQYWLDAVAPREVSA